MSNDTAVIAWCANESDRRLAEELVALSGEGTCALVLMRNGKAFSPAEARNCPAPPAEFATIPEAWEWVKENAPGRNVFIEAKFNHANLPDGAVQSFLDRCRSGEQTTDNICNYIIYTDAFLSYSPNRRGAAEIKDDFRFIGPDKNEIGFFLKRAERERRAPSVISLDLSPQCDKRCAKCLFHAPESPFRRHIPKREQMPFEMAMDLLRQAAEFDPKPVIAPTFSGEPLFYPRILEVLRAAKDLGLPVSVTTNAILMTPDVIDELVAMQVDTVMISLDAASPETYRKLQAPGDLERAASHIRHLLDVRKNGSPQVGITFVAEDENEHEFNAVLKEWEDVDYIVKSHKLDMVDSGNPLDPRNAEAPKNAPCSTSLGGLYVRHDGRIALCGYDVRSDNVQLRAGGSLSLKQIWESEEMETWRTRMLAPPYAYAFCKRCACREGQYLWDAREENHYVTISPITKTYKR